MKKKQTDRKPTDKNLLIQTQKNHNRNTRAF